MITVQSIVFALLPTFISAEASLVFLKELQSYQTFHSTAFNVILCPGSESINTIKALSASFRRFVQVHRADETLSMVLQEPQTFVLDLRCPMSGNILQQAEALRLFGKPFQWLLMTQNEDFDSVDESENQTESAQNWYWSHLETLSILVDSDVKVIEQTPDGRSTVTGVYKIQKTLLKEPLAEWTPENGLTVFNSKSVALRRWNLQGVVLPASMIILYPDSVNHFDDFVDIHLDRTTKINYNQIKLYEDLFNASVDVKIVKEWGSLVNGSWTGMVGNFERHEIEIGGSPLFFQEQRMGIVEYYDIITPQGITFIFLSPPLSSSKNIFVMPFDRIVWYCCFAMVVVSCILLFAAINYERSQLDIPKTTREVKQEESRVSLIEIVITNVGAICLQGTVTQTKDPPGRIITLFLYLSYMFLYISYSGSIVAILQSSDTSIQTLSDFLNSPLKAGAEDVVYNRVYFSTADEKIRKAIYNRKIAPKGERPHFLPLEEGIKEVQKGFYGFHVELSVGYQVIQRTFSEEEKCALQELKETFFLYILPWIVMKKNSPYAELIKIGAKKCTETGIKYRFANRFYTKKPPCSSKSSRFVSVGIIDCFYAFMMLTYGFLIAFIILLLEIIFDKYYKRLKKKNAKKNRSSHMEYFD